jgi:hypothetical protein
VPSLSHRRSGEGFAGRGIRLSAGGGCLPPLTISHFFCGGWWDLACWAMESSRKWAGEEFGRAELGDERRTRRLVKIAEATAGRPAGHITEVFDEGAGRTGAFRLMENDDVAPAAVAESASSACAHRSANEPFVFIPIDGSSLNLSDWGRTKGLGVVGARFVGAQGLIVMTAISVARDGTPLGLAGQAWWARRKATQRRRHDKRGVETRETRYWLEVMQQVRRAHAREAPSCQPWFQLDRGGDAWPVILEGLEPGQLFTVRAARDRRLYRAEDRERRYLWQQLESEPVLGRYELAVQAGPGRQGRTASIEVRAAEVVLDLKEYYSKRHHRAPVWAVLAREVGSTPTGEKPIEWLLLTSYPVRTLDDAQLVVFGYSQRWRIEEFHRVWKTGACRVEDTQLRDRDAIVRWATILASVAVRILRLTYLARASPHLPSTTELSPAEIDAVIVLKKKPTYRRGDIPPIGTLVEWIAELGGYTGKSSGGPPGPLVIARGLERIQSLARALADGL